MFGERAGGELDVRSINKAGLDRMNERASVHAVRSGQEVNTSTRSQPTLFL